MRQLESLAPAEIKAAIMEVFPESGHADAYELLDAVAAELNSSRRAVPDGWRASRVTELFAARVKAQLVRLAAEDTLIRVGAKDEPPDGTSAGRVSYWTPQAYDAARATHVKSQREAEEVELRWTLVANRLDVVQVHLKQNGSLTLEDWEHLLEATGL